MSLRTALTIVFSALITALLIYFILHNHATLKEQLTVFSFSFSVISALVGGMLISSAIPSAYFSVQWFKATSKLKKQKKEGLSQTRDASEWQKISDLIAHEHVEKAIALLDKHPDDGQPDHRLIRADLLMEQCRYDDVVKLLEPEFQNNPLPEQGYLIAEAYRMSGSEERSKMVLETLINRFPDDSIRAMDLLLEDAVDNQNWSEALKWGKRRFGMTQEKNRDLKELLIGLEYEVLKEKSTSIIDKKHISVLQSFLKENPQFVPGHLLLSHAFLEMGQEAKAIQTLEKGFEITQHHELLERVVSHYVRKEQPEEAIRLTKHISVQRDSALASFELGRLYFNLAMYDDARTTLEPLTSKFVRHHLIFQLLAEVENKSARPKKAFEYLMEALQPNDSGVIILGSYVCDYCGDLQDSWNDRCHECGSWNTIRLNLEPTPPQTVVNLT